MVKISNDNFIIHANRCTDGVKQRISAKNAILSQYDGNKGVISAYHHSDGYAELHVIQKEDGFYMHRDGGLPAFESASGSAIFCIQGDTYKIEDLPCDDVTKTYLMLKYDLISADDGQWYFHVYKTGSNNFE